VCHQITSQNRSSLPTNSAIEPQYDGDGDGLPDLWERKYFGNLSQTGGGDFEGDGLTNLQEYQTGSNPTAGDPAGAAWLILFTPLQ